MKAQKVLCINDDTQLNAIADLFGAFSQLVPVKHMDLPQHLKGSELSRLQGVYSKLQTVSLFSSGCSRQPTFSRFLLMDGDMLVRSNIDDVFAYKAPAGVMRGDADSCLFEPRPPHTFFHPDTTMRQGDSHPPMKGGINGGLVLFKPDEDKHKDMMNELQKNVPKTQMAEQEFLSYFWGRSGDLNAMHKKYNFQLLIMYLASPQAPPGQNRQSSFAYMVDHQEEIRVFHFSADEKPSGILINDMKPVQGWLRLEDHLKEHAQWMMETHGKRNPALPNHPEWIKKIEKLLHDAHVEWFEAWKRTYANVVSFDLETAYNKMVCARKDDGDHVRCPSCGDEWHTSDIKEECSTIGDHLLFNCPELASDIKIHSKHQINLLTFFFVPCGDQVESKLLYLAEVYRFYGRVNRPSWRRPLPPLPMNLRQQPHILLPLYTIPPCVLATTERRGVDASTRTAEEPVATWKAVQRRYERAIHTLKKEANIYGYRNDSRKAEEWKNTLNNVREAGTWLMKHDKSFTAFTQSTARRSTPASSSSGQPMMTATANEPATGGPPAAWLQVTPPWRQHEASASAARAQSAPSWLRQPGNYPPRARPRGSSGGDQPREEPRRVSRTETLHCNAAVGVTGCRGYAAAA